LNLDGAGNWVIASSNLKKLIRLLDDYFRNVLLKKIEDLQELNADQMGVYHSLLKTILIHCN